MLPTLIGSTQVKEAGKRGEKPVGGASLTHPTVPLKKPTRFVLGMGDVSGLRPPYARRTFQNIGRPWRTPVRSVRQTPGWKYMPVGM